MTAASLASFPEETMGVCPAPNMASVSELVGLAACSGYQHGTGVISLLLPGLGLVGSLVTCTCLGNMYFALPQGQFLP